MDRSSSATNIRRALKAVALRLPYNVRDFYTNRRKATAEHRFLVVRHAGKQPYRYRYFLQWIEEEFPQIRSRMELRLMPYRPRSWERYVLHIPWLQDPVEAWAAGTYRACQRLANDCDRLGIPVINRVERMSNCIKSIGARIMESAGIRTPRTVRIEDPAEFRSELGGLALPLLVRENRGHGRPSYLIRRREELDQVPFARMDRPIGVEFIDVRDPDDGLYRKYRYLATGSAGVTRHLIVGDHWELRPKNRVLNTHARAEELRYLEQPEPNYAALERARQALGLDLLAFDYSYDSHGRMVVWEANPYPDLSFSTHPARAHLWPYVRRSLAAVLRMYLDKARLPVPDRLDEMLAGQSQPAVASQPATGIPESSAA